MDVKTYRASSLQAALQQVRRELGPDASVLHTREVKGGMLRWLAGRQIEVTASATIKVPSRLPPPAAPIAAKPLPPADYDDFRAKYRADLKGGETEVDSLVEHLSLEAAPAAAAERAKFKASGQYRASRDLVDAVKNGTVELKKLDRKELPEELQKLDDKELSATLKKKETERAALQKQIQELSQKRDSFLAAARAKEAEKTGKETFDSALLRAVREQATRQGYKVPAQP